MLQEKTAPQSRKSHPGAARVGVGGPVGSGKTALLEQLIPRFIARGTNIAVVTNDLVTKEDAERIRRSGLIAPERVMAVETGACPHTAIREDPTLNIQAADLLEDRFAPLDLILIESGGERACFLGDLVPTTHHLPLPWIMGYDVEPLRTLESRRALYERALAEDWLLVFQHDPAVALGRLARAERGVTLVEPRTIG